MYVENDNLVSVIIPIYNAEKHLLKGLNVISNQTYRNIEIIVIDDGSTDKTLNLAKQKMQEDDRIILVEQENSGPGAAREKGLSIARGKYVYFFDIDDSCDATLIEYNVSLCEELNLDLVIFGFYVRKNGDIEEDIVAFDKSVANNNEQFKSIYLQQLYKVKYGNGFIWNKFYRRAMLNLNNVHFMNQRIQQDETFNLQVYKNVNRAYVSDKALYHYVIYNKNNVSAKYMADKMEDVTDIYRCFNRLIEEWIIADSKYIKYVNQRYLIQAFSVMLNNYYHQDCHLSYLDRYKGIKRDFQRDELRACQKREGLEIKGNLFLKFLKILFNHRSALGIALFSPLYHRVKRIRA